MARRRYARKQRKLPAELQADLRWEAQKTASTPKPQQQRGTSDHAHTHLRVKLRLVTAEDITTSLQGIPDAEDTIQQLLKGIAQMKLEHAAEATLANALSQNRLPAAATACI